MNSCWPVPQWSTDHERSGGGADQDPNASEDPPQRTHDEDHPSTGAQ